MAIPICVLLLISWAALPRDRTNVGAGTIPYIRLETNLSTSTVGKPLFKNLRETMLGERFSTHSVSRARAELNGARLRRHREILRRQPRREILRRSLHEIRHLEIHHHATRCRESHGFGIRQP